MPTLEKIVSVWAAVCEFSEWGSIISHPALETQCAAFVGEVGERDGFSVATDSLLHSCHNLCPEKAANTMGGVLRVAANS